MEEAMTKISIAELSIEEFKSEIEELNSKGLKFDVKTQGGNACISVSKCNVRVDQIYEDFDGEVIIEKPEADVKIEIDFAIIDDVFREGTEYYLQTCDIMPAILIGISE